MGGSTKTQSTSAAPWQPAQAGLQSVLDRAQSIGGDSSIWTPTYSANTTGGVAALGNLGSQPSFGAGAIKNAVGQTQAGMGAGVDALTNSANGSMLNANQYLDPVINKALQDTADKVNSQFSAAGRYGSGAHTGALTRELGGLDMNARLSNYQTERGNQMAAANSLGSLGMQGAQLAPGADQAAAQMTGYQLQAGQLQDAMDQARRMAPATAAQWQAGLTTPIAGLGGTQTGTTTQNPSTAGMIAGGGMMGLGLLTGNPMLVAGGASGIGGGAYGSGNGGAAGAGVGKPLFGLLS
jgi:hypothetical protein